MFPSMSLSQCRSNTFSNYRISSHETHWHQRTNCPTNWYGDSGKFTYIVWYSMNQPFKPPPPATRIHLLEKMPSSLPKLLKVVKWNQHKDVTLVQILYCACEMYTVCALHNILCCCLCVMSLRGSLATFYHV